MRHLLVSIALVLLLPGLVFADASGQTTQLDEQLQSPLAEPNESDLTTHDHYTNKSGLSVHSPAKSKSGKIPVGASAQCRDGTYSFSQSRRGTCSRHGGVASWL